MSNRDYFYALAVMAAVVATIVAVLLGMFVTGIVETERAKVKFDYHRPLL